jgi:hypothetical protein
VLGWEQVHLLGYLLLVPQDLLGEERLLEEGRGRNSQFADFLFVKSHVQLQFLQPNLVSSVRQLNLPLGPLHNAHLQINLLFYLTQGNSVVLQLVDQGSGLVFWLVL